MHSNDNTNNKSGQPNSGVYGLGASPQRLRTAEGRQVYAERKCTVEPIFGMIKSVLRFRQFLLRGLQTVGHEWTLVCIGWNLKRLHRLQAAA